jgi:hypothetical protein
MAKPTQQRLTPSKTFKLQDFLEAMFEAMSSSPTHAHRFSEQAKKRGVSFELVVHEAIARGCHSQRQPLPPELHEYLMQHATKLDPKIRTKLLKPLVN